MRVHYVNLARRSDRNERFLRLNSGILDCVRVEGVDGTTLSLPELVRSGLARPGAKGYSPGSLGCSLSHRSLWERAAAGLEAVTVAEDDAVLNVHFAARAERLLAALPGGWDIVLWGWNFDHVLVVEVLPRLKRALMQFDPRALGARAVDFQRSDHEVQHLRLAAAFGLVCYTVSPRGARRLLDRCFPLGGRTIRVPGVRRPLGESDLDVAMNGCYAELGAYVAFPPLAWTDNDKRSSDVQAPPPWTARARARLLSIARAALGRRRPDLDVPGAGGAG